VSYWADSAFIAAAGIPTVLFGPGGAGAHAAEEWVSLADTEVVARTLLSVAERLCR
jgi:acetylornithine deacetylase